MKKNRIFALVLVLAMAFTLSACGSGSSSKADRTTGAAAGFGAYEENAEYEAAEYDTTDVMELPTQDSDATPSAYQNAEVKLIRRASLSLETKDFDAAQVGLEQLVKTVGGYIESSDLNQGSYGSSWRSVYYTIRVPADKYDTFLNGVHQTADCHLVSQNESTEDVGAAYFDAESHLATLKTKLERLQALLKDAKKMEDIITIESAISETEHSIEQYSSDLKRYDSLIGYATFNVSLEMVANLSDTDANPFTQRLKDAFVSGLSSFGEGVQGATLFVVGHILQILLWIAVVFGLRKLYLFASRNKANRAVEPKRTQKKGLLHRKKALPVEESTPEEDANEDNEDDE